MFGLLLGIIIIIAYSYGQALIKLDRVILIPIQICLLQLQIGPPTSARQIS